MADLSKKDLKYYPHFDGLINLEEIQKLVCDPDRVAKHRFYPFIRYEDAWKPFRKKKNNPEKAKKKPRPIRFASRKDACIFKYYRNILLEKYEDKLKEFGITDCPIAYRKIKKNNGSGKCNIDFAKEAFDEIKKQSEEHGGCVAIALDIKSYFEKLDHDKIKEIWCYLLGEERLPDDHFTVFNNITRYHYVEQKEAYHRLGFLEKIKDNGRIRDIYTTTRKDMPRQLCTPDEFRSKICPKGNSIINANTDEKGKPLNHGIPQGAPISDLIANFYLLHFDEILNNYVKSIGGYYRRYSDDILLIVPGNAEIGKQAEKFVIEEIQKHGENLKINSKKTCIVQFNQTNDKLNFKSLSEPLGKNGFEYLGLQFNGQRVLIRDSSISNFYRKVSKRAKAEAYRIAAANPDKNAKQLIDIFNYSAFREYFMKVRRQPYPEINIMDSTGKIQRKKFDRDDPKTWTFYTYLKRVIKTFPSQGNLITKQIRKFEKIMKERVAKAITKAVVRRDKAATKNH